MSTWQSKKKTEKKVDYYIGVDNNAPYYYKDADGTEKGLYVTFLNELFNSRIAYICSDGYFCFRTKSFEQSDDGFIGSTVVKTGEKSFLK